MKTVHSLRARWRGGDGTPLLLAQRRATRPPPAPSAAELAVDEARERLAEAVPAPPRLRLLGGLVIAGVFVGFAVEAAPAVGSPSTEEEEAVAVRVNAVAVAVVRRPFTLGAPATAAASGFGKAVLEFVACEGVTTCTTSLSSSVSLRVWRWSIPSTLAAGEAKREGGSRDEALCAAGVVEGTR